MRLVELADALSSMPLMELNWYDKSPLTAVLRRNPGRWIHFSRGAPNRDAVHVPLLPEPAKPDYYRKDQMHRYRRELAAVRRKNAVYSVPKLGVNPRSHWKDPKGIYFYPVEFLLSGFRRIVNDHQYGLDYPYYYIAELNLHDPRGVDLGTMTWDQVEAIATRNGWLDTMQEFRRLPLDQQKARLFGYARPETPGGFFWHFIDRMVRDGKMSWGQAYKGVSFIRDPNLSIIHDNEPDQVLVLDPRIIRIVEAGENTRPIRAGEGSDQIAQWMHALMSIIKRIRGEYGGTLSWKYQRPSLEFTKGVGRFTLTIPERSGTLNPGLMLSYRWGRALGQLMIPYESLRTDSLDQLVQRLAERIELVAGRRSDLLFTPLIGIAAARQVLTQRLAAELPLVVQVAIHNPETGDGSRHGAVDLSGELTREIDGVTIKTTGTLWVTPTELSVSCNVWAGKQYVISAHNDYASFTDPAAALANLAGKVRENFDRMSQYYAPRTADHYDHARFDSANVLTAFQGWMATNCGLSLDGAMRQLFAKEIAAYEAYPERRALLADIVYVMNSKWY